MTEEPAELSHAVHTIRQKLEGGLTRCQGVLVITAVKGGRTTDFPEVELGG